MVPGVSSSTDQLFSSLSTLKSQWPKGGWSWDNRFNTVTSSFHVDLTSEAEQAIVGILPTEFDHRSIGSASVALREITEAAGGVRPDQRVFSSATEGRMFVYGLWWPWGDEITVSLRVGLGGYVGETDRYRLQELFNAMD
jgi:hypothetical protein